MSIQDIASKPTSTSELMRLMNGQVKIITYPELVKYKSIDQLLYPYNKVIILYLQKKGYGHWTCLHKHGDLIEHFDSYGYYPDDELDFKIDSYFRKINNQDFSHLLLLLYKAKDKYKLSFNEHKFQEKDRDISTCGRHCVVRLWNSHIPLKEYKKMMYSTKYTPDELVTLLTT